MDAHSPLPRGSQRHILHKALQSCSAFRSRRGEIFVKIPVGPLAHDTAALHSAKFRQWIIGAFFRECAALPDPALVTGVLRTGEALAASNHCAELPVGLRLLADAEKIILDLATPNRDCIKITAHDWHPGDALSVGFAHTAVTQALPVPVASTDALDRLQAMLPVVSGADWIRTLIWLTAALQPEMPAPVLILEGPSGSGKSTAARHLRSLTDPSAAPFTQLPATAAGVRRSGDESRILVFDQVGRIPERIAAALSEAADEQHHPIILIRAAGSSAPLPETLARRSLTVNLRQLTALRTLYDLKREFDEIQPGVLAALCTAVSSALARRDTYVARSYPRLPDLTAWALAAAPALTLSESSICSAVLQLPPVPEPSSASQPAVSVVYAGDVLPPETTKTFVKSVANTISGLTSTPRRSRQREDRLQS